MPLFPLCHVFIDVIIYKYTIIYTYIILYRIGQCPLQTTQLLYIHNANCSLFFKIKVIVEDYIRQTSISVMTIVTLFFFGWW